MPFSKSRSPEIRLSERRHSEFILTVDFARQVREVAAKLPRTTTFSDLYFASHTSPSMLAGEEWYRFITGLRQEKNGRVKKRGLTMALTGISQITTGPGKKPLTLGEFDEYVSERGDLQGWKIRETTDDFLQVAFGHLGDIRENKTPLLPRRIKSRN